MKRFFSVLIPVLILGSLISWRLVQKQSDTADQAKMKSRKGPAVVTLAKVEVRDLVHVFEAEGTVEAPLSVKIAPKITGRIVSLNVREGDRVSKGQALVRIDDSQIEANVRQQTASVAEAQYKLAQAQMNQNPTDVSVNTQIRQQKANVTSAQADYKQVQKSYDAQLAAANANLSDADSKIENAKASVRSAQANIDNAQAKFDRVSSLFKKGYVAAQEVDDAKAALTVQKSALDIAQGQLKSVTAQREAVAQQLVVVKAKGEADIESAKTKLDQAKASLEYAKANTSQKSAYRQSISALKASVDAAQAQLASAKSQRSDTVLTCPLDGFVTGRYADPGAITSPTQPVLAVQFIKQVWVSIPVPEEVCGKIHISQPAKITFDSFPGRTFEASVVQINPSADLQSRQFTVRVIMSNAENLFKPGMFARVAIETDRLKSSVAVPREAVQKDSKGTYVMAMSEDKTAKRVDVAPQGEDTDYIAIGNVIKPGQPVVTLSAMPLKDGQKLVPGGRKGKRGEGKGADKQ